MQLVAQLLHFIEQVLQPFDPADVQGKPPAPDATPWLSRVGRLLRLVLLLLLLLLLLLELVLDQEVDDGLQWFGSSSSRESASASGSSSYSYSSSIRRLAVVSSG